MHTVHKHPKTLQSLEIYCDTQIAGLCITMASEATLALGRLHRQQRRNFEIAVQIDQ